MSTENFCDPLGSPERASEWLGFPWEFPELGAPSQCHWQYRSSTVRRTTDSSESRRIKAGIAARVSHAELQARTLKELSEVRMGRRKVEAVKSWKDRRLSHFGRQAMENISLEDIIPQYFDAFNDIIFSGYLGNGCCKIEWVDEFNLAPNKVGEAQTYRNRHTSIIRILRRPRIISTQDRLRAYVSTLLHEMAHSFADLYTSEDYGHEKCQRGLEETSGHTGHGFTWLLITRAIEDTAFWTLEMHLPLGRLDAFRREIAGCLKVAERKLEEAIEELGLVVHVTKEDLNIRVGHAEWGRDRGGHMK
ncbi:hypothetical protein CJF32_00004882 [Rutstroemia sp. NJR-2017a WRK4]|nr:hypothetical protein CJF32_00004882 [Rutstroemia sp. NJR-2017a WRK4]